MLPNFLIIGAARCATTWLSKNLMEHPDIYLHPKKELHFFDRDYHKGIQFYEKYFEQKNKKAIGEATPAYLYFEHISSLIKLHIPDVKLIVSLRNPTERAYSHHWNLLSKEIKNKSSVCINRFENRIKKDERIIKEGFYYDMLSRYFEKFSREKILVVIFEELMKNPTKEFMNIYNFLGVDAENYNRIIKQKINNTSAKMGKNRLLYLLYLAFMKKLKFYKAASFIEKINRQDLPKMENETRKRLDEIFEEQIIKLEELLKKDLSIWQNKKTLGN